MQHLISVQEPTKALLLLFKIVLFVTTLHFLFGTLYFLSGNQIHHALYQVFNIGADRNFPTYVASSLWLIAAGLSWKIFDSQKNRNVKYNSAWLAIAALSLFISLDEYLMIHEQLIVPFREMFAGVPYFWYGWVVPYGLAVIVIALLFVKFLIQIDRKTRFLLLLSGLIFVVGALGFEMLGAKLVHDGRSATVQYAILYSIEEILEMVGVSLFLFTLLDYMKVNDNKAV